MGRIRLAGVLFACVVAINCGNSSPTNPETPPSTGGGGSGSGGGGTGGGTGLTAPYTDEVFNDNDWQDTIQQLFGAGGSAFVGHRTNGGVGNTDYRRIEIRVVDSQGAQVAAFSIRRGDSYFPSSDGAILSIDYSEDSILVSGGGSQSSAPALMQDGKLYTLAVGSGAFSTPDLGWTHHSLTGLKQSDFRTLASASEHPNFSSSGSRIDPGFMRLYTVPGGDNISGIDNWRITLYR